MNLHRRRCLTGLPSKRYMPSYNRGIKRVSYTLIFFLILSGLATASPASGASGAQGDIRSLVSRIIAAYGGKEVVGGIRSIYAAGKIEAFMRHDHGTYEVCFKRPRKLRVATEYRRSSEIRILNGDRGYRGTDNGPLSEAGGDSLLAMVYQYKHFDLPYGLMEGSYSVSVKGKEDLLHGKPVEVLHLTDGEGPPMDVYVDTHDFFIVKVTGYFTVGDRSTALSAEFSDFRKVDGTVFPFRIMNYAGGYKIAETVMRVYRLNPAIPDSLFAP